ncbi:MAG TPA: o-succinylbenzoate synthase, partial [Actinomycetota bacterium]|nr:o-succinylbenzoate synthase [Actinomycetota bacterium]
ALIDLDLRERGVSLAEHLGGTRELVECGISIGIQGSVEGLLEAVSAAVSRGYRRVKLKIEPGTDIEPVSAVREAFPEIPLSVDANAAYDPASPDPLLSLDHLELEYIEQPFPEEALLANVELQRRLRTPVCLDETITSATRAEEAIRLDACRVINVKVGRVGGLTESLTIHGIAAAAGVALWCGGMLETGIGRAVNVAVASLPGFTKPGDTSPSDRYFERDITEPFEMALDGTMEVPRSPGIGRRPDPGRLSKVTVLRERIRA